METETMAVNQEQYDIMQAALSRIVSLDRKDPERSPGDSMGNYDDVFSDGIVQGEFYGYSECATIAKQALVDADAAKPLLDS